MSPSQTQPKTEPAETPPVTVDPGQVIRVNARFPNKPTKILFSYLPPHSDDAVHDPGAGEVSSQIQRDGDDDIYHYNIDTRGMRGGLGWWYFVSEDADPSKRRAKVGRFIVRDVPAALVNRNYEVALDSEPSGFDLLGAELATDDDSSVSPVLIGVGVVIGAALLLL